MQAFSHDVQKAFYPVQSLDQPLNHTEQSLNITAMQLSTKTFVAGSTQSLKRDEILVQYISTCKQVFFIV